MQFVSGEDADCGGCTPANRIATTRNYLKRMRAARGLRLAAHVKMAGARLRGFSLEESPKYLQCRAGKTSRRHIRRASHHAGLPPRCGAIHSRVADAPGGALYAGIS